MRPAPIKQIVALSFQFLHCLQWIKKKKKSPKTKLITKNNKQAAFHLIKIKMKACILALQQARFRTASPARPSRQA